MINESLCRFRRQTPTSVGMNNCIANLNHARFISLAAIPTWANKHIIFDVDKKVCPPTERVWMRLKIFVAILHGFDTRYTGEIKPIIEHSYAKYLHKLLLVF